MAKNSNANPLERYIEKAVLGLCALLLIFAVAHWVVSSPQTVPVINPDSPSSMTEVPPDQADETIFAAAERVRQRNQREQPGSPEKINWQSLFGGAAGKPFPGIALVDEGTPSFPIQQPRPIDANALPSLAELTAMVQPPGKPFGWSGLEVRQPAVEEAVFHGVSLYPWGDLKKRWEEKLSRLPNATIVVLRVEVQVQTRGPDGQFHDEEGVPAPLASLPPVDSQGQVLPMPVIPDYDGNNATAVRGATLVLAAPRWQWYNLTPPYYKIAYSRGGWVTWRIHLADNPVSKLDLAPAVVTPTGVPLPAPTPFPSGRGGGEGMRGPFPGMERGPTPGMTRGPVPGMAAPGGTTPGGYMPAGSGSGVGAETVGPVPIEEPVPLGVPVNTIPDLAKQKEAGEVLITFHDNTPKIGVEYRWRVKLVLVNPLLTQDAVQNKARDSFAKEIASRWSEWSDPVVVQNPTHFFLTRKLTNGQYQVTVFTQKMGQTVKMTFDLDPGMAIGGPAMVRIAMAGNVPQSVNFSTGCVAVALDERPYAKRSAAGGYQTATSSPAMLYLDDKGQLRWCVLAEDEASAEYERLRREAGGSP